MITIRSQRPTLANMMLPPTPPAHPIYQPDFQPHTIPNTTAAYHSLLSAATLCNSSPPVSGSPLLSWLAASTQRANLLLYQLFHHTAKTTAESIGSYQKLKGMDEKYEMGFLRSHKAAVFGFSASEKKIKTKEKGKDADLQIEKLPQAKKRSNRALKNQSCKTKSDKADKSPISGIVIKKLKKDGGNQQTTKADTGEATSQLMGDIDTKFNVVDRSESSRKKLQAITNVIGDYQCKLCQVKFSDAYCLAEHRCPSIVYIEYKCSECLKVFNCPANLASHRRWHKPRPRKEEEKDKSS